MIALLMGLVELLLAAGFIAFVAVMLFVFSTLFKGPRALFGGGLRRKLAWIALVVLVFKVWEHFQRRHSQGPMSPQRPPYPWI